MTLVAWLPVAIITVLHYTTSSHQHWLHDIFRRLYYMPILFGAFSRGLVGGLGVAVVVVAVYTPHAFTHVGHMDPARSLEKSLEMILYVLIGCVAGWLVDRERRKHEDLLATGRKLEEALEEQRRAVDQLIRAGRLAALGEMVAGIAHEIKNPLHSLEGTAEIVDAVVPENAPQRHMWELHLDEIRRLKRVLERFLSFARPAAPERRTTDIVGIVERVRHLVSSQDRQQHVRIVKEDPPTGFDPTLRGDEEQLVQVLLNISLNALQAMAKDGGSLAYSFRRESRGAREYVLVLVSNTGPSIPEGDLERIFDPFVTTKSDGIGLGLSIASRIVEQHDGFIEVANHPQGRGVTFTVCLPV